MSASNILPFYSQMQGPDPGPTELKGRNLTSSGWSLQGLTLLPGEGKGSGSVGGSSLACVFQ